MKIAVVTSCVPFGRSVLDEFLDAFVVKLNEFGHEAGLVRLPLAGDTTVEILTSMVAATAYRIRDVDRIVVHAFPSCYIPHESKAAWIFRRFQPGPDQEQLRIVVRSADRLNLPSERLYSASDAIADQFRELSSLDCTVMSPPAGEGYRCDSFENFVLYPMAAGSSGRTNVVRALLSTRSEVRLHVLPLGAEPKAVQRLGNLIAEMNVERKVTVEPHPVEPARKMELYARCLAVTYEQAGDVEEPFIASQASASNKAVLLLDSRGVGAAPTSADASRALPISHDASDLAAAMDRLYGDRDSAARLGALAGAQSSSWQRVIGALTQ